MLLPHIIKTFMILLPAWVFTTYGSRMPHVPIRFAFLISTRLLIFPARRPYLRLRTSQKAQGLIQAKNDSGYRFWVREFLRPNSIIKLVFLRKRDFYLFYDNTILEDRVSIK